MTGTGETGHYHHAWSGTETVVRETLRRLYLLRLVAQGRCPTERLGAISTGGVLDPHRLHAEIGDLTLLLRKCSDDERLALEVEVMHEDLPVGRVKEPEAPARGAYYRVVRLRSKCEELSLRTAAAWHPRKYFIAVNAGFRKVELSMRLRGAL
jgi:hypothetical protein